MNVNIFTCYVYPVEKKKLLILQSYLSYRQECLKTHNIIIIRKKLNFN